MKFLRNNGLSVALLTLFLFLWIGQAIVGHLEDNGDRQEHARAPLSFNQYLHSNHFLEATFENWESEFLQMSAYVVLTAFLFQRGSAESKDPDQPRDSKTAVTGKSPSWVRRGGWRRKLYEHSLSLALFTLFLVSWLGHLIAGRALYNDDQIEHGLAAVSLGKYFISSRFWFESLQNWQSEFLAVAAIVILSIWLREKGSPESKAVVSAHTDTGK